KRHAGEKRHFGDMPRTANQFICDERFFAEPVMHHESNALKVQNSFASVKDGDEFFCEKLRKFFRAAGLRLEPARAAVYRAPWKRYITQRPFQFLEPTIREQRPL